MDVTLRQFRYFEALARNLNFGRAARECAVTQPALSMQIADFEAKLGFPLVERIRSGMVLTEAGQEVARRVRRILGEVRDLTAHGGAGEGMLRGALKLGVIPSIAPYVLPRLLPGLRDAFPDLKLQLRETLTRSLVAELLDGHLDLLLLALPIVEPGIETVEIARDEFLLAAPRGFAQQHKRWSIDTLAASETLLLLEEGHCLRDQALAYCELQRNERLDAFGVSSISTIVQMVRNGHGVTLLPAVAAPLELENVSTVELLRFDPPAPTRMVGLAFRASSPHKAEFSAFGDLVRACLEALKLAGSEPAATGIRSGDGVPQGG